MFQMTDTEFIKLVTNCDQFKDLRFSYQNPYAFVAERHVLLNYNQLFARIENIEHHQLIAPYFQGHDL